ncbi:MAG TPA: hypothetical protein VIX90_00460 [Edaphobacter sp.]
MRDKLKPTSRTRAAGHTLSYGLNPFALFPLIVLIGCATSTPLARHTADFSGATSLVVDNSENAYRAAVRLHDQEQAALAVAKYDSDKPWDPHSLKPLINANGLQARSDVLDGLKAYAQSLADVTNGVDSPQLNAAASSIGTNLQAFGQTVNPTQPAGTPPTTSSLISGFTITPEEANVTSTAFKALGDYLVSRKIKSAVPKVINDMDPQIQAITQLLNSDLIIIRRQSALDYEQLLTQQDMFIRKSGSALSPTERRAEIEKLPGILSSKQSTDDMLADLQNCLTQLALTHHALAAAAQNTNAVTLQQRIDDLRAAAERLARFYFSLPTT